VLERSPLNFGKQYVILPIQTNGGANAKTSQKQHLPLQARGPHLIHQCLPPLTTPNDILIRSCTSTQLCNKGPIAIGYNGTPQFTPKTAPSTSTITIPSNTPFTRWTPLTTPNSIRIQSAILPQYTLWTDRQRDRQTDRETDGPGECSVPSALCSLC